MAENSLQNQKNEASFVLSEKANAIIEKFEEKLCKNNFSREDKYSIRTELIWYLFGKKYPEIIGIIEGVLSNCSSKEQAVSSFIKEIGDGTTIAKDNNTIAFIVLLGLFLISLNRTNADTRLLDMLEAEQLETLTRELPAILAYYYHVITIHDSENTKDDFLQLCFGLFSITPQFKFVLDSSHTERNNPCTGTYWLSAAINSMVGYNMLTDPPLGVFDWVAIEDGQYCLSSKDSSLHDFISNNLTDKGILFYLVSSSTINKDDRSSFRKWVIENKYLHGIIEIHGKQVMIIRRQHADSIFFVNATDDSFLNEGHWNVGKLLEVVNTKDGHYYKEVSFEEFASYNSKFSTFAKRQLAPSVIANEGETVVTIGDLVDLYESETMEDVSCFFLNRPYYFENGYYEPIEAVTTPLARRIPNDEFFLFKWDVLSQKFLCSYLDSIEIRNLPRRFMYDDFYDSENNPIICTYPDAIVFTLKDKPIVPVHPEYLAKLFSSNMVIRQMDYFREYHTSIDSVNYPDLASYFVDNEGFLSIKVSIPSLNEQSQMLDMWHKETYLNTKKEIQKNFESYKQDIRMKKHAMAQRLATMNNCWKILLKARKDGNGIVNDEATVGHLHPVSVKNIYTQIGHEMNMLFKQLSSFNLGDAMDGNEVFDAAAFVREYIKHHDPMFEYQCELPDKPANIRFPKEAFQIVMDNIASNACSHGFKGKETGENIIRVMMEIKGHDLIVHVSNNGKPMPVKMTAEKVFTYGDTTEEGVGEHSGLGGFEIKDLMTKFGGEVELLLDAEAEFPVTYILVFRDVNIYK